MTSSKAARALFLRNVIFGVEDSLVSTVGLLSGITLGATPRSIVLLTGLVYVFVEGFSMAVGSFLSEEGAQEYAGNKKSALGSSIFGAFVMLVSFVIAGFIPLIPYILLADQSAIWVSVAASILALFLLGVAGGKLAGTGMISRGLRMALLGGFAIAIGVLVSHFFRV
ncbi:MAG: VIT1/CCC1 transporter family protein [bacterium]